MPPRLALNFVWAAISASQALRVHVCHLTSWVLGVQAYHVTWQEFCHNHTPKFTEKKLHWLSSTFKIKLSVLFPWDRLLCSLEHMYYVPQVDSELLPLLLCLQGAGFIGLHHHAQLKLNIQTQSSAQSHQLDAYMLRKDNIESLCFLYLSFYKRRKPCAENIVSTRSTATSLSWRLSLSIHGHHGSACKCVLCLLCDQNPDCSQVTMPRGWVLPERACFCWTIILC